MKIQKVSAGTRLISSMGTPKWWATVCITLVFNPCPISIPMIQTFNKHIINFYNQLLIVPEDPTTTLPSA